MGDAVRGPSSSLPETPAARAALGAELRAATGLDEAVLERLVRRFYAVARADPEIGRFFDAVEDWEAHIATITRFWASVALMTGTYHGQPMPVHAGLGAGNGEQGLGRAHFARWLALFEQAARETCPAPAVPYLMEKARRIAESLALGVAVARGELPPRENTKGRPGG